MKKQLNRQTLQLPYRNPTKALLFTRRTPTAYLRNTYKMDYKTDGRWQAHKKTHKITHTPPKRPTHWPTKKPTNSDGKFDESKR